MDEKKQEILDKFINDCELRNFSKKSLLAYKSHVRYFLSMYQIDCQKQDLSDFLLLIRDKKELSSSTVENYFISITAFYDFLVWEGVIKKNIVPDFRKRYVRYYKKSDSEERQLISMNQMKSLILIPDNIMWKTIFLMLAKTGMRRQEIIDLDFNDIDLRGNKIYLKKHHVKRSNKVLFIDDELHFFLAQWLKKRNNNKWNKEKWLFRSDSGTRIYSDLLLYTTIIHAEKLGFHNRNGRLNQKYGVHCFRHFFTTRMLESGCPREYVQELRGDVRKEAIDIYHHIPIEKLKEVYLSFIFKFGLN